MNHDPETGEILDENDDRGYSATKVNTPDGGQIAKRSGHVADILRMLEGGQFNADASIEMRGLTKAIEEYAANNKGAAKGQMTITLDMSLGNGVLVVTPSTKVKAPVQKRMGTALFIGGEGSLGRNPQGEPAMFGDRKPRDEFEDRKPRDL